MSDPKSGTIELTVCITALTREGARMGRSPGQQLITFYMDRATARRFLSVANELGWSRSALLRQMIADFLHAAGTEHDD
jgi:hypothetical protein